MPWTTPNLRSVRETVRGEITTALGRASFVGNSVLRVIADATAGLTHLVLRYIDWLALQLLPDTAETEWLDRHGDIWLVNADNTVGRKMATVARGTANFIGISGTVVPAATQLTNGDLTFQTEAQVIIGTSTTPVAIVALDAGKASNLEPGTPLASIETLDGIDTIVVGDLSGGTDTETDEQLRARVLRRIRQPPMGGAEHDYEAWALAVPGVTRAWAEGNEMGMGTVTLRFMMDDLRADNDGFPLSQDIDTVSSYVNSRRPVSVKDMFIIAPIPQPIDFNIVNLNPDTPATRAAVEANIKDMLYTYAAPGQTIYAAWKFGAIMTAHEVISFNMETTTDDVMPSPGHMAVLGDVYYTDSNIPPVGPMITGPGGNV